MRRWILGISALAFAVLTVRSAAAQDAPPTSPRAAAWWRDIAVLADDNMEGRMTGSPGYMRAAAYVISRFKAEGLQPAGLDGYLQPIAFEQQSVLAQASTVDLVGADDAHVPLKVGSDVLIAASGAPRPTQVHAPLVFAGYGLHMPEAGYDDFAGLDLKGKIAVVISGGPADLSGALKSHARFERNRYLARVGAVGVITLTTPKAVEIPWPRQQLLATQPGMYLADPALRDTPDGFFVAGLDPAQSAVLFQGSGHDFADLAAAADGSAPVPRFPLALRLDAHIVVQRERLTSPNLVARLPGSDPALADQDVVLSAHLDHLGIGAPINGDRIYNGAMDDASGVATLLDVAHRLATGPQRPRRSILVLILTAEEKGLLGSHAFAERPTVPARDLVADLNFDMPLPLWPLKGVLALGDVESTLGADARAAAAQEGIEVWPDPLPNRNLFIRTDQYSFVRKGVPSLALKFGFKLGTPQAQIDKAWRAQRYHSPSDDLSQPVDKTAAVQFDGYVAALALRIADDPQRPQWLADSFFKRFATP